MDRSWRKKSWNSIYKIRRPSWSWRSSSDPSLHWLCTSILYSDTVFSEWDQVAIIEFFQFQQKLGTYFSFLLQRKCLELNWRSNCCCVNFDEEYTRGKLKGTVHDSWTRKENKIMKFYSSDKIVQRGKSLKFEIVQCTLHILCNFQACIQITKVNKEIF